MNKPERILYDGSAESVDRIMSLIGTKGVNNTPDYLIIDGFMFFRGDIISENVREEIELENLRGTA
jgi:hypothetical protein